MKEKEEGSVRNTGQGYPLGASMQRHNIANCITIIFVCFWDILVIMFEAFYTLVLLKDNHIIIEGCNNRVIEFKNQNQTEGNDTINIILNIIICIYPCFSVLIKRNVHKICLKLCCFDADKSVCEDGEIA